MIQFKAVVVATENNLFSSGCLESSLIKSPITKARTRSPKMSKILGVTFIFFFGFISILEKKSFFFLSEKLFYFFSKAFSNLLRSDPVMASTSYTRFGSEDLFAFFDTEVDDIIASSL